MVALHIIYTALGGGAIAFDGATAILHTYVAMALEVVLYSCCFGGAVAVQLFGGCSSLVNLG